MLEDTLRLLPYVLGVVMTPSVLHHARVARGRREVAELVAGLVVALFGSAAVGLLVDLDGPRSSRVGGFAVVAVAALTAASALSGTNAPPAGLPGTWPRRARTPDGRKIIALAVAVGVSADNTGGVAVAELRNVTVFVVMVVIGVVGLGRRLDSPPSNVAPWLLAAAAGIAIDGMWILS